MTNYKDKCTEQLATNKISLILRPKYDNRLQKYTNRGLYL